MDQPIPPPDQSGSGPTCSIADCLLPEATSFLACAEIMDKVRQEAFHEGRHLPLELYDGRNITIIAVGPVSLEWSLSEGRRHVLDFLFRGDILSAPTGDHALHAVALSDGILYRVACDALEQCCRQGAFGNWPTSLIGAQLNQVTTQTLLLGRLTATEKLASFLMLLARRIGTPVNAEIHIELPMNRDYIADYLGLNAETVSRQLSKLKKQGVIRLPKPGSVEIVDETALADLSPLN